MKTRIISGIVAIPLLLFFIIVGGLPLRIVTAILSLIGMYEIYRAVSGKIKPVHFVGFLLEIIYAYTMYFSELSEYLKAELFFAALFGISIIAVILVLIILVFDHKRSNIHDAGITFFGFLYVGVLLNLICEIRDVNIFYAWLPFIFAFVSDTGAYFTGSFIGKLKLTPELSPKKTIEGSVGGVIITAIFTGVYVYICSNIYTNMDISISFYVIVGVIGAILSQIGDLAASSIKRFTGIKDYGNLMPGHGGVLDRFDSVLFTTPLVFIIAYSDWLLYSIKNLFRFIYHFN